VVAAGVKGDGAAVDVIRTVSGVVVDERTGSGELILQVGQRRGPAFARAPIRRLEIRIESVNSRFRQAVRRRGHFPTERSAMKILYLTVRERRPNRSNPTGKINGWTSILNTLAITYCDRLTIN
jgi:hypothetical protein